MFKTEKYGAFLELIPESMRESLEERYKTMKDTVMENLSGLKESMEYSGERNEEGTFLENPSREVKKETNYEKEILDMKKKRVEEQSIGFDLNFEEDLMKAMVYTEVFGKPKSKRRRR